MASTTSPILNANGRDLGAAYLVDQPAFQGPIDLLLHLIERQEMEVTEIAIVNVTDAYLQTLEHLEELEPGALADFLVVASRLLYIKSRALLPKPKTNEDDEEEEDPGDALLRQLIEYRQFKEVAKTLKDRDIAGLRVYVRNAPGPDLEKRLDLSNVDMDSLQRAVRRALDRIPSEAPLPKVHTYAITISQQISNIREHIIGVQRKLRTPQVVGKKTKESVIFTGLLSQSTSRMEIIVTFLAVLELIKQQEIEAVQDDVFSEIMLMPLESLIEEADAPPKEETDGDTTEGAVIEADGEVDLDEAELDEVIADVSDEAELEEVIADVSDEAELEDAIADVSGEAELDEVIADVSGEAELDEVIADVSDEAELDEVITDVSDEAELDEVITDVSGEP